MLCIHHKLVEAKSLDVELRYLYSYWVNKAIQELETFILES